MDLEIVLHLPTRRRPVRLDGTGGAAREPQECATNVVDFHPPGAALAIHRSAIIVTQSPITRVIGPAAGPIRNSAVASARLPISASAPPPAGS
jgi:hypothetical protein